LRIQIQIDISSPIIGIVQLLTIPLFNLMITPRQKVNVVSKSQQSKRKMINKRKKMKNV